MTINIPGYLQWVSYLAGSEWPQGDEDAMRRMGDYWRDAAGDLGDLIPDLNRVRSETLSVLMGETADAADEQFAMLFDGDYSVDKLAEAMAALGDLCDNAGTETEYTKLQVITTLAIAAAEILWALAAAPETFGGSLSAIPITEAITTMTVRQLVSYLLKQLVEKLGEALTKTAVRRLLKEVGRETAISLVQELGIQGYQAAAGHRDGIDWNQVKNTGVSAAVGSAAAMPVHSGASRALGNAETAAGSAVKGAVSGYTAGVAGNVAGTLATGGELDATAIFGGAASSAATGGISGGRAHGGDTATPARPNTGGAAQEGGTAQHSNGDQSSHSADGHQSSNGPATSNSAPSHHDAPASSNTPGSTGAHDANHTAASAAPPANGESAHQSSTPADPSGQSGPTSEQGHPAGLPENGAHPNGSEPVGHAEGQDVSGRQATDHPDGAAPHDNSSSESGTAREPAGPASGPAPNSDVPQHTPPATDHPASPNQPAQPATAAPAAAATAPTTPTAPSATAAASTAPGTPTSPPQHSGAPAPAARPSLSEPPAAKPSATPAGIPATRTAKAAVAKEHAPLEANAAPAAAASGPDTGAQRSAPQQSSDHRAPTDRSTTTDRNSPTSRGGDERAGESADRTHTPADHAELAAPRPDPVDAVMPVLERHGVTLDEFMAMQDRAAQVGRDDLVNHFSTAELQMMYEARTAHPHPDADAVIQKIVSEPAVRSILDQVNNPGAPYDAAGRFHADDVGGCVSVASDAAHLRTPQDLLHAMRLDYGNGSPYETFTTTDHAYVVEGRIGAGDHFVPNGRVTDHLGISDPHVQDLPSGAPPHTGTGYTGDRHGLNPEYQLVDGKWAPGATLFRVDPNGSRHPVAMLDDSGTAWVAAKAPGDTVADGWPQHKGGEWIFPNSPEHGPHPDPSDPAHRGSGFDHADTGPPDPAARRVFEDSAIDTEPGAAFFDPADSEMRDAVGGVPEFPGEFTVDVHGDEHGVSVWDSAGNEHRMSARDFADVLRNHTQWDGHSPIRLLSCDTGADRHGFASELARELGVPVTAPDRPVWTFPDGRQPVVASVELRPNGEERPRIPPDGGWNRFEPDGSMHRSTEHPAAQHTEADSEARARGRDGELPTQLPEAPVQRAQALDEAARRAQESHAARVEEVNSRRADLKALESERRGADEAAKAVLKAKIEAATEELRDAQNRAAESRELLRAVSNAEHSAETAHHEADRAVPIDAAEVAAQRHRVDEIRAEIDEQQDRLRQLAREEADVRARLQQNDDPAVADQLRAERRELLSALREARDTLRDSDATLREAGDALRDSEWDRRSPQDRHEQLSREAAVARRQLADRYAEFVSGDNARAAAEAARGGSAEAAALAHVREVQQASAQARRIDLDVEIRAQIDRAVAQYMESRIRTDGREHPWVARELMSNTDRQAHWPVLDLQHLRQQIAMEMGDAVAWQFDRQMRGLTRCTATEVAQALGIFHDDGIHPSRGGNTPARESFERALAGQLHDEANRLVAEGRFADADAFIAERVAHVVSHLAALHEQDCAGAGADHIQTYMGWPVLADGNINSSLGSIWKQMVLDPDGNPARFYEAIRAVAQRQIAAGRGGEPLDIWYRNLD